MLAVIFRFFTNCFASIALIANPSLLQAEDLGGGLVIDVSSGVHNPQNPVDIFLEAGHYSLHPVGVAQGGYFDASSAWNGNVLGCYGDAHLCVVGWTRELTISAPIVDLRPTIYDDWLNLEVLQCRQAALSADRPFWSIFPAWDSPSAALEAYRSAANADGPCSFEVKRGGFVNFFERELNNPYATGGVSVHVIGSATPQRVEVDVFPDDGSNTLNSLSRYRVPVLLYGSPSVDLTVLRPETLSFTLLSSPIRFSPSAECVAEDVNRDGLIDQTCVFTAAHAERPTASENKVSRARLDGLLAKGGRILGQDVLTLGTKNAP